jgi:hypothetical protein
MIVTKQRGKTLRHVLIIASALSMLNVSAPAKARVKVDMSAITARSSWITRSTRGS